MNANAHQRAFGRDEKAVSVMVGALLLVGIFVATMVTVRVTYVPVWEEEREAGLARTVDRALGNLQNAMEGVVGNRSTTPISEQIPLGDRSGSTFRLPPLPNSIEFHSGGSTFTLTSPDLRIHTEDGADYTRLNETFTAIVPGSSVVDVDEVRTFRIRVDSIDGGYDGGAVTITITDEDGDGAGSFQAEVTDTPSGYNVALTTTDRWGTILYADTDAYFDEDPRSPYWIDLLAPSLRFDQVLRSAGGRFDLALSDSLVDAAYTITYSQRGAQGEIVQADGGRDEAPFSFTREGGTLEYIAQNRYFVTNGWTLEHGGLMLSQQDGAVMKQGPLFQAAVVSDVTSLRLFLPTLTGDGTSLAGSSVVTVAVRPEETYHLSGEAEAITLTIDTAQPALWRELWNDTLTPIGLAAGTHFTTSATTTSATLTVEGISAAGGVRDVYIDFHQADLRLSIEG